MSYYNNIFLLQNTYSLKLNKWKTFEILDNTFIIIQLYLLNFMDVLIWSLCLYNLFQLPCANRLFRYSLELLVLLEEPVNVDLLYFVACFHPLLHRLSTLLSLQSYTKYQVQALSSNVHSTIFARYFIAPCLQYLEMFPVLLSWVTILELIYRCLEIVDFLAKELQYTASLL